MSAALARKETYFHEDVFVILLYFPGNPLDKRNSLNSYRNLCRRMAITHARRLRVQLHYTVRESVFPDRPTKVLKIYTHLYT